MKTIIKIKDILLKNRNFTTGIIFITLGLILPSLITVNSFGIYDNIFLSLENSDTSILIIAAFKISILNSIRALPLYVGAFYVTYSVPLIRKRPLFHFIFVFMILSICYTVVKIHYDISYDFSYPAIILILVIFLLEKYEMSNVSILKKISVMILILIGVQFLDLVPSLSKYGFGRGEISTDIKNIATIIDNYDVLSLFSITFFIIFLFNAFLVLKILNDQHNLLRISNERRLAEIELSNSKLLAIENRSTEEIQSLVHDLKTPLTSIQGLSSVVELKVDDPDIKEYNKRISKSADSMNEMISQILHENTRSIIKVDTLIDYVFSQLVSSSIKDKVSLYNNLKDEKIKINKIRFSRAIINIIENSYNSIDKEYGRINILVSKKESFIILRIIDNGKGISEDRLNHIWDIGYSESGSTGLGLNFVKKVIENHNGTIDIKSKLKQGTIVIIKIKEVI